MKSLITVGAIVCLLSIFSSCDNVNENSKNTHKGSDEIQYYSDISPTGKLSGLAPLLNETKLIGLIIEELKKGFCGFNGQVKSEHKGYTGVGYADSINESGASISWQIHIPQRGNFDLLITYASGAKTNKATLNVEGQTQNINFNITENEWENWQVLKINVPMDQGVNTISLRATAQAGLPNIDSIKIISREPIKPSNCKGIVYPSEISF
ncbi:carbohydrate-binding protein [Marinicellulosiphila megalodicopiae]|uniref:carbohydrate-binding protein n=1 Tax=Marinicellulosiphila megalodicopiae TaxID=2724896 RepID=UPI003BB2226C